MPEADARAKMDKYAREATAEPLNRQGRIVLNQARRSNPHMETAGQFLMIAPKLSCDGPDCIEGAVWQESTSDLLATMLMPSSSARSSNPRDIKSYGILDNRRA